MMNVLVVEDSAALRERIVAAVAEVVGVVAVSEAGSVASALAALELAVPDLVVLDMGLPDGSGLDVLERLERHSYGTEVIVFTGQEGNMFRRHCLRAGATRFLGKEEGLESLQSAIRELADSKREPLSVTIVDESAESDFGSLLRELRRSGFAPRWQSVTTKEELAKADRADVVIWWRPLGQIDVARLSAAPLIVIRENGAEEPALAAHSDAIRLRESELGRLGAQMARALADRRARLEREVLDRQVQAAATLAAAGRLSLGLAHDVGNIVTAIQRSVSILLRPPSEHSILAEAQRIDQACGSLVGLARKLVRLGVPVREPRQEILEPERVVQETLDMLARLLGRDIGVSIEVEPSTPRVRGCRTELEQIIVNLALNARDAMPEGGRLRVRLSGGVDGSFRMEVEDTGGGIDEKARKHLFEPFYTTKAFGRGTGVGLATVKAIVERWGGEIDVTSSDAGTSFVLHIPAVADDDAA